MSRFVIGLTGGIASGKSTVAERFAARGVPVVDADRIARDVVAPGEPALERIVESFGEEVVDANGELRREHLRQRIFDSEEDRQRLEAIVHPAVHAEMGRQVHAAEGPYVIMMAPLLVEVGSSVDVDRVLVVDAPESVQIERLMARDGVDRDRALRMLEAQASREERLAAADDVLRNDDGEAVLDDLVERLHRVYTEMAHDPDARAAKIVLPDTETAE